MSTQPFLTPTEFSAGTGGKIAADDPRLEALLNGASQAVRTFCGWHVAPVITETVVLDGPGGPLLLLPTLRVASVTSISESGATLEPEVYEWSRDGKIRRRCGRWSSRYRSVEVELAHGFDHARVADLVQVVQQVVANAIVSPLGATREQAGQVSMQWSTTAPGVSGGLSLLQRDLDVLSRYRLPQAA